jgi:hypothetical protein
MNMTPMRPNMLKTNMPKNPSKRHSVPEPTGADKRPTTAEEERTETLKILLGDAELELENEDSESGSDPHNNTEKPSVDRQYSK